MTDRPDAPEALSSNAPVAPDAASTSAPAPSSKSASGMAGTEGSALDAQPAAKMGRRKLIYAAPVVMSQSMFYALAGCGKAQPQQLNCFRVPRSGS